jgi:hypothetical protein
MLDPGIDNGSKNGALKITHDMKSPRSPITPRKSFNVMPSMGIFLEISDITTENCSSLSNLSDTIITSKLLLLLFKEWNTLWNIFDSNSCY